MSAIALYSESDEYSPYPPIYAYASFLQISQQNSLRLTFPVYVQNTGSPSYPSWFDNHNKT